MRGKSRWGLVERNLSKIGNNNGKEAMIVL